MSSRVPLAKLSRPRLYRAVPRERLFTLLDAARTQRSATCVVGPPGAGKTTLVASWLEARDVPGIWCQVDNSDADLSTFFFYLAGASKTFTRRGQRALPLLTPEYQSDIAGFARRFFRELFARLPAGAVLTLDNYQEVPPDELFHRIVALAVDEVPPGMSLVAISRRDPPDCYARLLANENVAVVDWRNLRLDRDEAEAVARLHGAARTEVVSQLHRTTDGWAAGLVLALEGAAALRDPAEAAHSTLDSTFTYFTSEIFSRVQAETQRFLMLTAYLPDIPASLAMRLTGNARAGAILEDLYRRHLFTYRKPGAEAVYSYHALFQGFLKAQSVQRLTASELQQVRLQAAALLHDRSFEAALELYGEAHAWQEAERLIVQEAAALIAQGRWKVVKEHISRLPSDRVAHSRWLSCWLGIALTPSAPVEARAHLERSFALATAEADTQCRIRAAAGVIQTYLLEYNAFRPLDRWAETLLQAIAGVSFPAADAEVLARSALVTAFSFRQPAHPALEVSALRVFELLPSVADVNLRLSAAASILAWGSLAGPIEMAHHALPVVTSLWRHTDVTPLNAAVAGYLISWYHCLMRNRAECLDALRVLEDIYRRDGLIAAGSYAGTIGAWLEMYEGDISAAQLWLDRLSQTIDPARSFDRAMLDGTRGWMYLLQSQPQAALLHNTHAVETFDQLGSVLHQGVFRQHIVWSNIMLRDWEEARRHIAANRPLAASFATPWLEMRMRIAEAYMAAECGDLPLALERLQAALTLAREHGLDFAFRPFSRWMPRLCALAFEAGIEKDYARHLIRRYEWSPPPERPEHWPWPVRIYALGGFQVLVNDQPLVFTHKTPRKPIALLKAIVALGDQGVPTSRLLDALWPDVDGDKAYHSFGLTLHRLRRLLGDSEAVVLSEGKVGLNQQLVWTDSAHCDRMLARPLFDSDSLDAVLRLYRGHLLMDSDEHAWAITAREAMRDRLVRTVGDFALGLEGQGGHAAAAGWYERGFQADALAEDFSQGLMRCYVAAGQPHRATAALERLKRICQARLGVLPSAQTLALARSLSLEVA